MFAIKLPLHGSDRRPNAAYRSARSGRATFGHEASWERKPGGTGMTMTAPDFARGGVSAELLRVVDLAKHYGGEAAIAGVTFSAAAGEVLGIVGPNGAGKTTLLEAIAGLVGTDAGDVFWLGDALAPSRRKTAMFYLPDGIRPYQDRFTIE